LAEPDAPASVAEPDVETTETAPDAQTSVDESDADPPEAAPDTQTPKAGPDGEQVTEDQIRGLLSWFVDDEEQSVGIVAGVTTKEERLVVGYGRLSADEIVPLGRVDLLETVHHFDLQHSGGHSVHNPSAR